MLTLKDGNYHKDIKMSSLIQDQMTTMSIEQLNANSNCYYNKKRQKQRNDNTNEKLDPNSNKANRIKIVELITKTNQIDVKNVSKSSTNYHTQSNIQKHEHDIIKESKKIKNNNKAFIAKSDNRNVASSGNSLNCIVIHETIANNNINSNELLDQFEDYYLEKFQPLEQNAQITKTNLLIKEEIERKTKQKPKETIYYDVSLNYSLGLSSISSLPSKSNQHLITYHKEKKWFAYVHYNLIIIEKFQENSNRTQLLLNNSKVPLSSIKLSLNGKILYSSHHSTTKHQATFYPPFILFYSYRDNIFKFISRCDFPSNETILDYSMSPTNSFCIVTTIDTNKTYYLYCLDYINSEILIKTAIGQECNTITWNAYVSGIEFITFNANAYSIWTIRLENVEFKEDKRELSIINKGVFITSLDYSPPIALRCIIMLLISLSNGTVLVYNFEMNTLAAKYTAMDIFQEVNDVYINDIAITMNSITVIYNNKMRYFRLPLLSQINEDNLNLFSIKTKVDMEVDSNIISSDFNTLLSCCQGILLTSLGYLYYFNFEEESNVRLFNFTPSMYSIKDILIINNNIKDISLQNYANANANTASIRSENKGGYTIVSLHDKGMIKIWSMPEYYLKYIIEVKEDICLMTQIPNDTKILISAYSGVIRIIDTTKGVLIGKINIKVFIGDNNYLKTIRCFPEGKYFFGVDNKHNILYLINMESLNPLSLHFNNIVTNIKFIKEIELSYKDPYNQYLISDNEDKVKLFSRKYMTIIQDLSFDKSIPQYDCIDQFDVIAYIEKSDFPHTVTRVKCQFSLNINKEPDKIYISTSVLIIQRDFRLRSVLKIISFDIPLLNYHIASSNYILYVFNEQVKYSQFALYEINEPKGNTIPLPFTDNYISSMISYDNKVAVIAYSFGFSIFELRNVLI